MKNYACKHCGSIDVFIDNRGTQKALVCGDCGKWLKWIGKDEIVLVKRFIENNKETFGSNRAVGNDIIVKAERCINDILSELKDARIPVETVDSVLLKFISATNELVYLKAGK